MIDFQKTYKAEAGMTYIEDCLNEGRTSGDGKYTELCSDWIKHRLHAPSVLMTTSCTHALELALHLMNLSQNDEVIVPSFTYPSTANAVLMAGGKVVFSQVCSEDLTLDPAKLEEKITEHTKAIIPVHYGGNLCQMDAIMTIAKNHDLMVIEDAAQGFLSTYKNRFAGTFGDFGCFSFHGTKDLIAGEGGALIINNPIYADRAAVFREKGTNRQAFLRGEVAFYEWVAKGSSYSPSELLMAVLFSQFEAADTILAARRRIYTIYSDFFQKKSFSCVSGFSTPSEDVKINGHLFYLRFTTDALGDAYKVYMKEQGIEAFGHFVPLHSSSYGRKISVNNEGFDVEEGIGHQLVRLPIYPNLTEEDIHKILQITETFMVEVTDGISGYSNL